MDSEFRHLEQQLRATNDISLSERYFSMCRRLQKVPDLEILQKYLNLTLADTSIASFHLQAFHLIQEILQLFPHPEIAWTLSETDTSDTYRRPRGWAPLVDDRNNLCYTQSQFETGLIDDLPGSARSVLQLTIFAAEGWLAVEVAFMLFTDGILRVHSIERYF